MIPFIDAALLQPVSVKARTRLLEEGQPVQHLYFIRKGCARIWFCRQKLQITTGFFFEGEVATSVECVLYNRESAFNIETLEPCDLWVLAKEDFDGQMSSNAAFKKWFQDYAIQRLVSNSYRLVSLIREKPAERYQLLFQQQPELFNRIAQRYLASYLGITSVSLSRIRSRR